MIYEDILFSKFNVFVKLNIAYHFARNLADRCSIQWSIMVQSLDIFDLISSSFLLNRGLMVVFAMTVVVVECLNEHIHG